MSGADRSKLQMTEPVRTVPRTKWSEGPVKDKCPTCDTSGPAVYVAEQHPTFCPWMMNNIHRCAEHDELLLPTENTCPLPDVPDTWTDPHNRITGRITEHA